MCTKRLIILLPCVSVQAVGVTIKKSTGPIKKSNTHSGFTMANEKKLHRLTTPSKDLAPLTEMQKTAPSKDLASPIEMHNTLPRRYVNIHICPLSKASICNATPLFS